MSDLFVIEKSVVDFAHEILAMQRKIDRLEYENEQLREYKDKYLRGLDEGLKNAKDNVGLIFSSLLEEGENENI